MRLFCADIGNTHTHIALLQDGKPVRSGQMPTADLARTDAGQGILGVLKQWESEAGQADGIAFCSVVPRATEDIRSVLVPPLISAPVFQLTAQTCRGVNIAYPRPNEIGQDRLANAVAANAFYGAPAVVIDMGTAVTFDIVTHAGYEGGIIAPGVEVMRRYLHEQTALLPQLDDSLAISGAIGKSTVDAMRIGCVIGFRGMIQALLDAVLGELADRNEGTPTVLATGGAGRLVESGLHPRAILVPELTVRGLAEAFRLNRDS